MKTKMLRLYDQGDVLLIENSPAETSGTPIPHDEQRGTVLAYGEATGHAHAIPAAHAATFVLNAQTLRLLRVPAPTLLRHEEHRALELPANTWLEVDGQVEYVPGALPRAVVD